MGATKSKRCWVLPERHRTHPREGRVPLGPDGAARRLRFAGAIAAPTCRPRGGFRRRLRASRRRRRQRRCCRRRAPAAIFSDVRASNEAISTSRSMPLSAKRTSATAREPLRGGPVATRFPERSFRDSMSSSRRTNTQNGSNATLAKPTSSARRSRSSATRSTPDCTNPTAARSSDASRSRLSSEPAVSTRRTVSPLFRRKATYCVPYS